MWFHYFNLIAITLNPTLAITTYQPVLQAIALKMLGCVYDAEDIVQDTFEKYLSVDHQKIQNHKAYLIRSVTNNCLKHLNSLKEKKKDYLDSVKLPEVFEKLDLSHLDLKYEMGQAMAVLHKKLGPLERGIFVLREGFDFEYEDLQEVFNKKKEHCRQLLCRAKDKLSKEAEKFSYNFDQDQYFEAFSKACSEGDMESLIAHIRSFVGDAQEK